MTNDEAKFVLNAYRPNGRDAGDKAMAEPLAQAKADPALAAWFARDQAHGAAVAARLREIPPPAGLREALLAGARASERKGTRRGWRHPAWLAAAASIALLVAAVVWWRLPQRAATLDQFAVDTVARGFVLQKRSADVGELKAWLTEQRGPLPEALPAHFAQLRALGCRTLEFRGRDVSLVCFERGGKEFHVFVARRDERAPLDGTNPPTPRFFERGRLVAAAWTDARHDYVVVSDADLPALRQLL